ncbi:hypothetical protein M0R45_002010 [Rubus argutus]|uniref:Uncharacterized protein n=1 Tax=Rubus argutus TaxID=59490 RepID=A0AAW1VEE3_RUBAR
MPNPRLLSPSVLQHRALCPPCRHRVEPVFISRSPCCPRCYCSCRHQWIIDRRRLHSAQAMATQRQAREVSNPSAPSSQGPVQVEPVLPLSPPHSAKPHRAQLLAVAADISARRQSLLSPCTSAVNLHLCRVISCCTQPHIVHRCPCSQSAPQPRQSHHGDVSSSTGRRRFQQRRPLLKWPPCLMKRELHKKKR